MLYALDLYDSSNYADVVANGCEKALKTNVTHVFIIQDDNVVRAKLSFSKAFIVCSTYLATVFLRILAYLECWCGSNRVYSIPIIV